MSSAAPGAADRVTLSKAIDTPAPTPPPLDCECLVIGAGMAGLTAATQMIHAGRSVMVLEARDRIGGRINTDRSTFEIPTDLGAFWLHQSDDYPNPLVAVANKVGIANLPDAQTGLAADGIHDAAAEFPEFKRTRDELDEMWRTTGDIDEPMSDLPAPPSKWSRVATDSLIPQDIGVQPEHASLVDFSALLPEENDRVVPGGMDQFVNTMAQGVPIRTGVPVTRVKWGKDGVEVTAGSQTWRAKKVLITVSTGVLESNAIEFDPPLPAWKRNAIDHVKMGLLDKIVLQFDHGVLPATEPGTFAHVMHDEGKPIEFVLEPFGSDVAVALVGGDFARQVEKDGDQVAVDYALGQLKKLCGDVDLKSHLKASKVTHWGNDPYSLGSYSAAEPGFHGMRAELAKPVDDVLYFAGEASEDHYATTVAGAYRSGLRAAAEMDGVPVPATPVGTSHAREK